MQEKVAHSTKILRCHTFPSEIHSRCNLGWDTLVNSKHRHHRHTCFTCESPVSLAPPSSSWVSSEWVACTGDGGAARQSGSWRRQKYKYFLSLRVWIFFGSHSTIYSLIHNVAMWGNEAENIEADIKSRKGAEANATQRERELLHVSGKEKTDEQKNIVGYLFGLLRMRQRGGRVRHVDVVVVNHLFVRVRNDNRSHLVWTLCIQRLTSSNDNNNVKINKTTQVLTNN